MAPQENLDGFEATGPSSVNVAEWCWELLVLLRFTHLFMVRSPTEITTLS